MPQLDQDDCVTTDLRVPSEILSSDSVRFGSLFVVVHHIAAVLDKQTNHAIGVQERLKRTDRLCKGRV